MNALVTARKEDATPLDAPYQTLLTTFLLLYNDGVIVARHGHICFISWTSILARLG
jgi:hypothetical protein